MRPTASTRGCCFAISVSLRNVAFVTAALLFLAPQAGAQSAPAIPSVDGPITGPGQMYPGLRPLTPGTEPADYGYVTEEFFVSGTTLTAAGVEQPYATRILVRSPKNHKRFSGIVVAEVMHSNGFAVTFEPSRHSFLLRGHVHVEIAGQQGNVNGTVKPYNPERYAPLAITSGGQTSPIVGHVCAPSRCPSRVRRGGEPLLPLIENAAFCRRAWRAAEGNSDRRY